MSSDRRKAPRQGRNEAGETWPGGFFSQRGAANPLLFFRGRFGSGTPHRNLHRPHVHRGRPGDPPPAPLSLRHFFHGKKNKIFEMFFRLESAAASGKIRLTHSQISDYIYMLYIGILRENPSAGAYAASDAEASWATGKPAKRHAGGCPISGKEWIRHEFTFFRRRQEQENVLFHQQ